jgi:heme/copper-type cytochrome/quinol oxidase subunit 4
MKIPSSACMFVFVTSQNILHILCLLHMWALELDQDESQNVVLSLFPIMTVV